MCLVGRESQLDELEGGTKTAQVCLNSVDINSAIVLFYKI